MEFYALALSVICIFSVFSQVMLVQKFGLHNRKSRSQRRRVKRHKSQFFENDRVMYCIVRIVSLCKGPVRMHQNSRNIFRS